MDIFSYTTHIVCKEMINGAIPTDEQIHFSLMVCQIPTQIHRAVVRKLMKELQVLLAIVMTVMAVATICSFGVHAYIYESEVSAIQTGVAVVVLVPLIVSMWQDLRKENA